MSPSSHGGIEITSATGGAFQENCYLVRCTATDKAVLVDPGAAASQLLETIRTEGLELEAVYLTHAHLDHVEGLPDVREFSDAPIHLHPTDLPLYERAADQAAAFGLTLPGPLPEIDEEIVVGRPLGVGEHAFQVRFTPGHAPGHVIFYSEEAGLALAGDVVFSGSIGRTDLPGGDFQTLMQSIREEILTLPDETRLLVGHGPDTTVGQERRGNPFLIPQVRGGYA